MFKNQLSKGKYANWKQCGFLAEINTTLADLAQVRPYCKRFKLWGRPPAIKKLLIPEKTWAGSRPGNSTVYPRIFENGRIMILGCPPASFADKQGHAFRLLHLRPRSCGNLQDSMMHHERTALYKRHRSVMIKRLGRVFK